jgi:hypothetical protein|tara:strand:- start:86 stop:559 length:474 start_codon:yes stop_codon:yes gene_type:complete
MVPISFQIVGYWHHKFLHKSPFLVYNGTINIEKQLNYIMKKDKNMKNKEPKLNEVEIRYQDDRVILGKHIEQDLTWVFVPHDGDWKGCATLEFDYYADGWWYHSQFISGGLEDVAKFWKQNMMLSERKMNDKEFEDSILNGYISEMSEGMHCLSHVG